MSARDSYFKRPSWKKIVTIAKKQFNFDFSLVFYDVTTLYFESFGQDELRKPGFPKDNKHNQPQILIGLVVSNDGFPIAYEIFEGNKFEGHTLIPVISSFKNKHRIKKLTVVADAGMLSLDNLSLLKKEKLNYIVGARTGNMPIQLLKNIRSSLKSIDGATLRVSAKHGDLICSFSSKRFRKDKHEMEKQIQKAEYTIRKPDKIRRMKFVENVNSKYQLNTKLIEKTKLLLGIKGYYTNLSKRIDNDTIISHYHNLWHVEQAFRVAKSDLQIRPIYHFKEKAIQAHILMCFMALVVSKYMEIKTDKSLKTMVDLLKNVTDATILDKLSGKKFVLRSEINDKTKGLLKKLGVWY